MKRILILPFVLGLCLMACTERNDFERRLDVADSLMGAVPFDSVYRMLCDMNKEAEKMPKGLRMRHLMQRSIAQFQSGHTPFKEDSICALLVDYYKENKEGNNAMSAYLLQGISHNNMKNIPDALRSFNLAIAVTDTSATDCDFETLGAIYGYIAMIFSSHYMTDEALKAYEHAEKFLSLPLMKADTRAHRGKTLVEAGRADEGIPLLKEAAEVFRTYNNPRKVADINTSSILWYIDRGELDTARIHLETYEHYYNVHVTREITNDREAAWCDMRGRYYIEKGDLDSAMYCYRKMQQSTKSAVLHQTAARGLTNIFMKLGQPDSTAKYAIQAHDFEGVLSSERTKHAMLSINAFYDYSRHQDMAHQKELEARDARNHLRNSLIGGAVVLFALLGLIRILRKQIHEKKRELHKSETQILEQQEELSDLLAQKTEAIYKLEQLMNENTINVKRMNEQAQTIQRLNEKIEEYCEKEAAPMRDYLLNDDPAVQTIREMARTRTVPGLKDWNALFAICEQYYPALRQIRERSNVNHTEYQVCVLTLLDFELNEILSLIGRNSSYLSTLRRRLLPKLFNRSGGAKEFDQLMIEFKKGKNEYISV